MARSGLNPAAVLPAAAAVAAGAAWISWLELDARVHARIREDFGEVCGLLVHGVQLGLGEREQELHALRIRPPAGPRR